MTRTTRLSHAAVAPKRREGSARDALPHFRVAAQLDAVLHQVYGRNGGRPFSRHISPSVTKAGVAHIRGESGRQ